MKKLIENIDKFEIICDNKNCNLKISETKVVEMKFWINKSCPKCGCNLLTEKDYYSPQNMITILKWVNKWFSWIMFFFPKAEHKEVSVKIHNED